MFRRKKLHRYLFALLLLVGCGYLTLNLWTPDRMNQTEIRISEWLDDMTIACNGYFTGYAKEFVWLKYAYVRKENRTFSIPCEGETPSYSFLHGKEGTPYIQWIKQLSVYPYMDVNDKGDASIKTTTIVLERIEAHNLYHTMCEWYNIFILSKLFKMAPKDLNILFLDDRPEGLMDETWKVLFGKIVRYTDLPEEALFKNIIWNVIGYESPLNFHALKKVDFAEDFHEFFIHAFGISSAKKLDCYKLNVTIILRRDYMTHPERVNISGGHIHRKFQNEEEIVSVVSDVFKGHSVSTLILENMSMRSQLSVITQTDVLIGMHGAGMAHTMFLPKHAVVFETFPEYWGFLQHFKAFSRWRGIKYMGWKNVDKNNEFEHFYTRIPPEVIKKHALVAKRYLCPI